MVGNSFAQQAPSDTSIILTQVCAYLILLIPLRLYAFAKRRIPTNIRGLGGGSLLIANHQSLADPFVILCHLPLYAFLRMLPIRFPTSHRMFIKPFLNPRFFPLLSLLGCYSIGETSHEKMVALFYTRKLLQEGYAVFLFPEGKINTKEDVQGLQKGVEFFKQDAHNVMFVRTHGFHGAKGLSFFLRRRSIVYGDILNTPLSMNAEEIQIYLNNL